MIAPSKEPGLTRLSFCLANIPDGGPKGSRSQFPWTPPSRTASDAINIVSNPAFQTVSVAFRCSEEAAWSHANVLHADGPTPEQRDLLRSTRDLPMRACSTAGDLVRGEARHLRKFGYSESCGTACSSDTPR